MGIFKKGTVTPEAPNPSTGNDAYLKLFQDAKAQDLGKVESGTNRGAFVDMLNDESGVDRGSPWCASFASYRIKKTAKELGIPVKIKLSAGVLDMRNKNESKVKKTGKIGWLVLLQHGNSDQGHCGIMGPDNQSIEGNTSSTDPGERNGGMVAIHTRVAGGVYGDLHVIGFLDPYELSDSVTVPVDNDGPSSKGWLAEYDTYIKQNASSALRECSVASLIGREARNPQEKEKFLCALFKAIATAESGLSPTNRYVESGLGKDAVTGEQNTSEGLFQVSYQDASIYSCDFDWAKDKKLSRTSPNKTIFNGIKNLDCAMRIFTKLLKQNSSFEVSGAKYWSVLRRSRDGFKTFSAALKKELQ